MPKEGFRMLTKAEMDAGDFWPCGSCKHRHYMEAMDSAMTCIDKNDCTGGYYPINGVKPEEPNTIFIPVTIHGEEVTLKMSIKTWNRIQDEVNKENNVIS